MTTRSVPWVIVRTELDGWAFMNAAAKGGEHEWEERLTVEEAARKYPQTMRGLKRQIDAALQGA